MKIKVFILLFCLLLSACSSFGPGHTESFNEEVELLSIEDYKETLLISLYNINEYEMLVPITEIINYTSNMSEDELLDLSDYCKDLIKNKPKNNIIKDTRFSLRWDRSKFVINERELFESGDYLIYNHKTNKYVEEVRVEWESWYAGPLAASFDLVVYIDEFVFYDYHVMS